MNSSQDTKTENVSQVGMAGAAEVGVAEAHDGAVFVLIASAVLINSWLVNTVDVVRHGVGVGAELHDAEGRTSPWKGMPHAICPDDGIDILDVVGNVVAVSFFFDRSRLAAKHYQPKGK